MFEGDLPKGMRLPAEEVRRLSEQDTPVLFPSITKQLDVVQMFDIMLKGSPIIADVTSIKISDDHDPNEPTHIKLEIAVTGINKQGD